MLSMTQQTKAGRTDEVKIMTHLETKKAEREYEPVVPHSLRRGLMAALVFIVLTCVGHYFKVWGA